MLLGVRIVSRQDILSLIYIPNFYVILDSDNLWSLSIPFNNSVVFKNTHDSMNWILANYVEIMYSRYEKDLGKFKQDLFANDSRH